MGAILKRIIVGLAVLLALGVVFVVGAAAIWAIVEFPWIAVPIGVAALAALIGHAALEL